MEDAGAVGGGKPFLVEVGRAEVGAEGGFGGEGW